ncbi:MAG: protein-disulfide reductase DsbD domain-containing protein [Pseudomonadota bacterium]
MIARQVWYAALGAIALILGADPAAAQIGGGERHVAIELIAETDTPAAGSEVELAFAATPEKGWHGYWQNPGDAGVETMLKWTLSAGVSAGPLRYPVPERLLIAGLMNYVYEGPYTQFVTLKVPAGLAAGTRLPVAVTVDYLVCTREICVPERAALSTVLTVGDGAIEPARRAQFDGWRRALPKPLGSTANFAIAGDRFTLAVPFPGGASADDAYFYPLTSGAVDYAAPQSVTRAGDTLTLTTKAATGKPSEVAGVLSAGGRGFVVRAVPGALAAAEPESGWLATAALAFLGAVVGGLILNIMPCVFPILSLKALSLAKSGQSESHARGEALAYTGGVVAVCVALGGVLLAIRAGGTSVGWGFQLTDPRVVFVLLLLAAGIAFNLAGLFEVPAPDVANRMSANGKGGAFATGALAAFVATPCAGPFMGVALGAALVLPTAAALLVFAGLGLGIALPFLLLGFVPALRQRLPKPGAWMDTFRKILSLPMFVTAVALAWLLGQLAGNDALGFALLALTGFVVVLWAAGVRQVRGLGIGAVAALLLVAIAGGGAWLVQRARAAPGAPVAAAGHEAFSETRLAALRAEGKPVFAYFTADWCLTCKVNEKVAIETEAVRAAFANAGVVVLVGDWTDGDPALGRFIERHNRAGVPLYLWYGTKVSGGGLAEPRVLPQVLTPGTLTGLTEGG